MSVPSCQACTIGTLTCPTAPTLKLIPRTCSCPLPLLQVKAEAQLPDAHDAVLPSRILHLPMAFDEKWTHDAISKYMRRYEGAGKTLCDSYLHCLILARLLGNVARCILGV